MQHQSIPDNKVAVINKTSWDADVLTMGVSCQILIQRPREGVHTAGRPVIGTVRYSVDETTEYKDIILSLVGKGECSWTESKSKHNSRNHKHTRHVHYKGTEVFVENHISILNKQLGSTAIILPGTYIYNFMFVLPNNIPPSFKDLTCTIAYQIRLKFQKASFFSIDKKFAKVLNVYGTVESTVPEGSAMFGLEKSLFRPLSKRTQTVNLKAVISNTIFSPGQNADIAFTVTNITDAKITSIKTELLCYTTYTANCGKRRNKSKTINDSTVETPSIPADAVANLSSVLPIQAHLYSIQNCRIMKKEYKVRVTLRLPMPYINATMEIPIVIGEKRCDGDERTMFAREAPGPSSEIEEASSNGPPSYWEAMNEDSDEKEDKGKE